MGFPVRLAIFALSLTLGCGGAAPQFGEQQRARMDRVGPALTCTQGPMVPGLDVSKFQGAIDWGQVKSAGFEFAFAKATEGVTYVDSNFQTYWSGMKSANVIRGAYHFFHPQDSGTAQADAYLAQVGQFQPGDLPPMLDWEVDDCSGGDGCASDDVNVSGCYAISLQVQRALDFISEIQARTGLTTIIYTYPYFWNCLGDPGPASSYLLWQATYPSTATTTSTTPPANTCPSVLAPWSTWTIWQWSSTGSVSGVSTNPTDLDVFNGTLADLQALTVQGATTNDFSISANPVSVNLGQGASGTSAISTAVIGGSAETLSLSASGLPSGASASLSPSSLTAGGSSTLTLEAGTAAAGTYTVTVTAAGASGTHSASVALSITALGTAITAPADGSTLSGSVTVTATASAGANKIELYADGVLFAAGTSSPFSSSWDTTKVADGAHALTSKAYDASSNTATSTAVNVTVSNGGTLQCPPGTTDVGGTCVPNSTGCSTRSGGAAGLLAALLAALALARRRRSWSLYRRNLARGGG